MNLEALIYVALVVGPLVGAVVGFGLQLRQIRQAKLANDKAQLEIAELQQKARAQRELSQKLQLEIEDLQSRIALGALNCEKASLEVEDLRARSAQAKRQLVSQVSTEDVLQYGVSEQLKATFEPEGRLGRSFPRTPSRSSTAVGHDPVFSRSAATWALDWPDVLRLLVYALAAYGAFQLCFWLFGRFARA